MMSPYKLLIAIVLLFAISGITTGATHGPAIASTQQHPNSPRFIHIATNRSAHKFNTHTDIKHFVTTIGLIHRYYIKDITNSELLGDAISGMLTNLDPHSAYLDAHALKQLHTAVSGQFVGIGIELTVENHLLKVISPLEGSPAAKAGIKTNDIIIKIDDTFVRNLSIDQAIEKIKGKKGTRVQLTILRKNNNQPLKLSVQRDTIRILGVKSRLLKPGYGYIRITFFQGPVEKQLKKAIQQLKRRGTLKGLVLDLRNNPGGLLDVSTNVANQFLDARKLKKYKRLIVYTKGRLPTSNLKIKATRGQLIPQVPMVVLINNGSASASEILTGALQDYHRAIIMGTRSFGKGSVQTVLPLSRDSAIKLTTALYYTPAGRAIQAQGITPDINVPNLTIKNKDTDTLNLDEAEFLHHLKNDQAVSQIQQGQQHNQSDYQLAKTDYQLYQALLVLQAISVSRSY